MRWLESLEQLLDKYKSIIVWIAIMYVAIAIYGWSQIPEAVSNPLRESENVCNVGE